MTGIFTSRLMIVATIAVAVAGSVDAVRSANADLLAVFLLVIALQLALLWRVRTARRLVGVRPDLAAWLDDRSVISGEPVEHLADRCISSHRRALEGQEATGG
jgi:Flp pilus assembly protein TadB